LPRVIRIKTEPASVTRCYVEISLLCRPIGEREVEMERSGKKRERRGETEKEWKERAY